MCTKCGAEWNPEICPACEKSNYRTEELVEILYENASDGSYCRDCRHVWREKHTDSGACPECGSEDVGESYPDIPDFQEDPLLSLIVAAEGCIPRAENGAILHREMVSWLRAHGVRCKWERLQWERWFLAIGSMRARLMEELMAPSPSKKSDEDDDEKAAYGR